MKSFLLAFCFLACLVFTCTGTSAQNVQLIKLDKLEKRLAQRKDTIFIVNFWATWCVPCLEELPHFEKLAVEHKGKKLKILLVSMDTRSKLQNTVVPFVRKSRLRNEVYLLNETNQQEFIPRIDSSWSGALPATLMISQNHRRFFEQPFTYAGLITEYNKIQRP